MDFIYPWLESHWSLIQSRIEQNRLPHGLLLAGPAGLGKRAFAERLAAGLLCDTPVAGGYPCGSCPRCKLRLAGTHPDLVSVAPEEGKQGILVDQVRELTARLGQTSHAGGFKVAVIQPADAMNTAAANSLLKTLEEPTDNTLMVLVTEQPARLPATIRSRCQLLRFQAPPRDVALAWLDTQGTAQETDLLLDLADGAPLKAAALADSGVMEARAAWLDALLSIRAGKTDPLRVAADWAGDEAVAPLHWLGSWLMDMIRLVSVPGARIRNRDLAEPLETLARPCSTTQLYQFLDQVWEAIRLSRTSVNRQLVIEGLLINWSRAQAQR